MNKIAFKLFFIFFHNYEYNLRENSFSLLYL